MKTDAAAACRFFTPGDACRMALAAYYAAGRHIALPPGTPWVVDGAPYAEAVDFTDAFLGELEARIALLSLDRLGHFEARHSDWDIYRVAAGIEPEKMRQIISDRETEMRQAGAELIGHPGHDLPGMGNVGHNQAGRHTGNAE